MRALDYFDCDYLNKKYAAIKHNSKNGFANKARTALVFKNNFNFIFIFIVNATSLFKENVWISKSVNRKPSDLIMKFGIVVL